MANQILQNIKKSIVDPAIQEIKNAVIGYIVLVYYEERKVDVIFKDNDGAERIAKGINFPKDGDGVFSQSLESGDKVELAYRNRSTNNMYISQVYKRNQSKADFICEKGQDLPTYTSLF